MEMGSQRTTPSEPDAWERRRKVNVRLGLLFGGLALALFLVALWKYRPL